MPQVNGIVTCVNHPNREMYRNNRPAVLHPVDLLEGQPTSIPHRGILLATYVCVECGYVEFYLVERQQLTDSWILPPTQM